MLFRRPILGVVCFLQIQFGVRCNHRIHPLHYWCVHTFDQRNKRLVRLVFYPFVDRALKLWLVANGTARLCVLLEIFRVWSNQWKVYLFNFSRLNVEWCRLTRLHIVAHEKSTKTSCVQLQRIPGRYASLWHVFAFYTDIPTRAYQQCVCEICTGSLVKKASGGVHSFRIQSVCNKALICRLGRSYSANRNGADSSPKQVDGLLFHLGRIICGKVARNKKSSQLGVLFYAAEFFCCCPALSCIHGRGRRAFYATLAWVCSSTASVLWPSHPSFSWSERHIAASETPQCFYRMKSTFHDSTWICFSGNCDGYCLIAALYLRACVQSLTTSSASVQMIPRPATRNFEAGCDGS